MTSTMIAWQEVDIEASIEGRDEPARKDARICDKIALPGCDKIAPAPATECNSPLRQNVTTEEIYRVKELPSKTTPLELLGSCEPKVSLDVSSPRGHLDDGFYDHRFGLGSARDHDLDGYLRLDPRVLSLGLKPLAFRLYCLILRRVDLSLRRDDREWGRFFQSLVSTAKTLQVTPTLLREALKELQTRALIVPGLSTPGGAQNWLVPKLNDLEQRGLIFPGFRVLRRTNGYVFVARSWIVNRAEIPDVSFRLLAELSSRSEPAYRLRSGRIVTAHSLKHLKIEDFIYEDAEDDLSPQGRKASKENRIQVKHLNIVARGLQTFDGLPTDEEFCDLFGIEKDQRYGSRRIQRARQKLLKREFIVERLGGLHYFIPKPADP